MSQKYTKEFKETIVQLHAAGQPVSDLVKEYGVANQTIYKWLQLYGKSKAENVSLHELQQMRKEMAKILTEFHQDKKEFIGLDNRLVREQVIDYLLSNYDVTDQTLLITNFDGGHEYTPYVFKEMAKVLRIKRHEHFWDEYHVNKKLKNYLKFYSEELLG